MSPWLYCKERMAYRPCYNLPTICMLFMLLHIEHALRLSETASDIVL